MVFSKLICNKRTLLSLCIRKINTTSYKFKTHYETLKLQRNCSPADIRDAYLKLSKQYHPDKNKDETSHKEFVKISEAYNVLSKPLSRRDYDLGLFNPSYGTARTTVRRSPEGVWSDENIWEYRDRRRDAYYRSRSYYGIGGLNRIADIWIVLLCVGFTAIGVLLQVLAIRRSVTLRREEMMKRSSDLDKLHSEIRETALRNGDKIQLELLVEKLNKDKHR